MTRAPEPYHDPIGDTLDLVRSAQAGDRTALDQLFARYYPRVKKIVHLRLGERIRRHTDSADVLQETFVAAVRSFDQFELRDRASFIHWLTKLAERRILTAYEKATAQKRDAKREVALDATRADGALDKKVEPSSDTLIPLDKLIRSEDRLAVEQALEELSEKHREVILLRNYSGMSFAQVATETGRASEGAARMEHARAMIELGRGLRRRMGARG